MRTIHDRKKGGDRMRFGDLVGNERVKRQLAADIDGERFPHALLIEGEIGSGRRTLAKAIARAAVCRGEGEIPCGVCDACRKSEHPDITVYGEEATISVDTVRDLRQEAYVMPNEAPRRVMILTNAQAMLPPAQNALLKILEEPPRHVLFILICENRTQLLETIRSRCVCVTMESVEWEEAAPLLRARLPRADEAELMRAHSLFGGRIGRVLDGMQDGTFRRVLDLTPQFAEAVIAPTELTLMRLTGVLEKDKELTAGVLSGLSLVFRDALTLSYGGQACLSTSPETAKKLASRLSGKRLMALVQQVGALQQAMRRNMNNTLFLTRLSACLREAAEGTR